MVLSLCLFSFLSRFISIILHLSLSLFHSLSLSLNCVMSIAIFPVTQQMPRVHCAKCPWFSHQPQITTKYRLSLSLSPSPSFSLFSYLSLSLSLYLSLLCHVNSDVSGDSTNPTCPLSKVSMVLTSVMDHNKI